MTIDELRGKVLKILDKVKCPAIPDTKSNHWFDIDDKDENSCVSLCIRFDIRTDIVESISIYHIALGSSSCEPILENWTIQFGSAFWRLENNPDVRAEFSTFGATWDDALAQLTPELMETFVTLIDREVEGQLAAALKRIAELEHQITRLKGSGGEPEPQTR
jgi:hypothetical protein